MIYTDSRYANGQVFKSLDSRYNEQHLGVRRRFPTQTLSYYTYVWKDGDRIDVIAQRVYGTSDKWSHIMDYNPEIADALNIVPGTQLRMPNG